MQTGIEMAAVEREVATAREAAAASLEVAEAAAQSTRGGGRGQVGRY